MGDFQRFESEMQGILALADTVRSGIGQAKAFMDRFAESETEAESNALAVENQNIRDLMENRAMLETKLAALVTGQESAATAFSNRIDGLKSPSFREKWQVGFPVARMRRMHAARIRRAPLAAELRQLISDSDTLLGFLKEQRMALVADYRVSEDRLVTVIDRRGRMIEEIDIAQFRLKQLDPKCRDILKRLEAASQPSSREELAREYEELVSESRRVTEEENRLIRETGLLERYIAMFEGFVDALNSQIAACNILINKLTIDTERRIALWMAQVNAVNDRATAEIDPAAYRHVRELLERHARNMLATQENSGRKQAADEAFDRWSAARGRT